MAAKPRRARKVTLPPMPTGLAPTPEAQRQSRYEVMRVIKNGPKVAVNKRPTPLRAAFDRGHITSRQVDAGERFEQWHVTAWSVFGTRDPLDPSPRGETHETATQAERAVRAKELLKRVEQEAGPKTYDRLVSVCVRHEPIGDCRLTYLGYARLICGLDVVADMLGLPESEDT